MFVVVVVFLEVVGGGEQQIVVAVEIVGPPIKASNVRQVRVLQRTE